ncbi:MAG: hypothetical protein H5T92_08920 [Synergistales bacterium]|nr:hypothetical protein [Synergistales bacterium]
MNCPYRHLMGLPVVEGENDDREGGERNKRRTLSFVKRAAAVRKEVPRDDREARRDLDRGRR